MAGRSAKRASDKHTTKRPRKSYSLELKLDVIRRIENGASAAEIGRILALPSSTVRSIKKEAANIRACVERCTPISSKLVTKKRNPLLEKMEHLLAIWIQEMNHMKSPISQAVIMEKAINLYSELKKMEASESANPASTATEEDFKASRGWFDRFRKRQNLHNLKPTGEFSSADTEAAQNFILDLQEIIEEGGYSAKQVFNVDETALFWKQMPSRIYVPDEEKVAPGCKAEDDRVTILLGGNAEGDCKLKPLLVYQSENPREVKDHPKSCLPVLWKSNKKARITSIIFQDFIVRYCAPYLRDYCERENLDFKILLLMDNATSHKLDYESLCPNIKVVFLPPNATSLLQPLDQGAIATVKAYYLWRTFRQMINETSGEGKITIRDFWQKFNIMDCIDNVAKSWEEVTKKCMNGVWSKLTPYFVDERNGIGDIGFVHRNIVSFASDVDFDEVDEDNGQESLEGHREDLTLEELMELDQQAAGEGRIEEEEVKEDKTLSFAKMREALSLLEMASNIFQENDPIFERSLKVSRALEEAVACYREIYRSKLKKSRQMTLDAFFANPTSSSSKSAEAMDENVSNFAERSPVDITVDTSDDDPDEPFPSEELASE